MKIRLNPIKIPLKSHEHVPFEISNPPQPSPPAERSAADPALCIAWPRGTPGAGQIRQRGGRCQ